MADGQITPLLEYDVITRDMLMFDMEETYFVNLKCTLTYHFVTWLMFIVYIYIHVYIYIYISGAIKCVLQIKCERVSGVWWMWRCLDVYENLNQTFNQHYGVWSLMIHYMQWFFYSTFVLLDFQSHLLISKGSNFNCNAIYRTIR